ncbi:hypothetical protein D5086_005993 [Populus alba]|uniref:Uncharacterized protein n=1 Tax=Populus alba TaxID=43335 RepID=A0ACC4CJU1_POPAL
MSQKSVLLASMKQRDANTGNKMVYELHPVMTLTSCDYDGKVTPEEVAAAAMYLKDTSGKEGIQELISCSDVLEGFYRLMEINKILSATEVKGAYFEIWYRLVSKEKRL